MTPAAEEILRQRRILVFPDFVANGGGVLGGTMEFAGIPLDAIDAFFRTRFAARMRALLREGPPGTLRERAERFALARFKSEKDRAESGGMGRSFFAAGLSAFRAGLLPSSLLRPFSMRYFEERVAE